MDRSSQRLVLVRHGETEWARDGRHTGRTDIPLTDLGRRQATVLGDRLRGRELVGVFSSPLSRALDTCRLAGLGEQAQISEDLLEWDYGVYEGLRTTEIRRTEPDWSVWHSAIPKGESVEQVGARADRALTWLAHEPGEAVVFSHGHFLRVLTARWLGLPADGGRLFALAPATISILGFEREQPVIIRWNDRCHLVLPSDVWAEQGDLDVRLGDPSVGSGDDRPGAPTTPSR